MKIKHYVWVFVLLIIVMTSGIVIVNVNADRGKTENLAEETKIRDVIYNYFDKRYHSRATNSVEDFRELTDDSPQANSFLDHEINKLDIEIYNAQLHHLRYTQYEYTLDFNDISIDEDNQMAIVSLAEGHDVVFEISEMITESEPLVSKMRNLSHEILLKKTQDGWKIISDNYDDYLWRLLKSSSFSKEELLLMINNGQGRLSNLAGVENSTSLCNLPFDESTHPYNRSGAVAYAHQYALTPNTAYYYFPDTDCTGFISQAIHHGSNAEEVGYNTFGWYYNYYNNYQDNDYSASWAGVEPLYDFIIQYNVWNKGPEGCQINNDYAAVEGDLVQFEWEGDAYWDHGVIIVERVEDLYDPYDPYFYVAGHSDNVDNYPLNNFIYQSRRFIRIERIDGYGYPQTYLPAMLNNTSGILQSVTINPYPAPMEDTTIISPYPAP